MLNTRLKMASYAWEKYLQAPVPRLSPTSVMPTACRPYGDVARTACKWNSISGGEASNDAEASAARRFERKYRCQTPFLMTNFCGALGWARSGRYCSPRYRHAFRILAR